LRFQFTRKYAKLGTRYSRNPNFETQLTSLKGK
jgi:hypothetical protein